MIELRLHEPVVAGSSVNEQYRRVAVASFDEEQFRIIPRHDRSLSAPLSGEQDARDQMCNPVMSVVGQTSNLRPIRTMPG